MPDSDIGSKTPRTSGGVTHGEHSRPDHPMLSMPTPRLNH